MRFANFTALVVVLVCLAGCGDDRPPLFNVSGKVMLDGAGVTAGAIYFHPKETNLWVKDTPGSLLQLDGSFRMKTFPYGDGVPSGKYKVTLTPELAGRINHPEYGSADKTPWEIDVAGDDITNHLFDVKPPGRGDILNP